MSSASDYESSHSLPDTSQAPSTLRDRPRVGLPFPQTSGSAARQKPESPRHRPPIDPSRIHNYYQKGRYNDAYRELFNEQVEAAAARFERDKNWQYSEMQLGTSVWSASEQATFFAALKRLGRNDLPGIAAAIRTKSIPEIQEYLLSLQDAAAKQGNAKITLRDIPASLEVSNDCIKHLDLAGQALAGFQETFEAKQEQEKFGGYWLITSDLAEDFENALDPQHKDPVPIATVGKRTVGACISCNKLKAKCDRNIPCGNCVKRNVPACVYKKPPIRPEQSDRPQSSTPIDVDLLQAIPEANLLRADVMLTLSKDVFMNRSPTLPSPWGHWSEYTSEFVDEPAIYRSAFNDLHTLVVSVAKRLTYTAIMQATSRLRSQRRRTSKGVQPGVKRRDVLAAIDVLGMKRNGRKRWAGVAQRCSLGVFIGSMYSGGKSKRTLSWDEVERFLRGGPAPSLEPPKSDVHTPLPLEQLGLSDSDLDADLDSDSADSPGSVRSDSEKIVLDEGHNPPGQYTSRNRDQSGRFSKALSNESIRTLENFDQEANQKEELALWEMLRIVPPSKKISTNPIEDEEMTGRDDEKIITDADEWRAWTEYKAEWEEFQHPIPRNTPKTRNPASATHSVDSHVTESSSEESTNQQRHRPRTFDDDSSSMSDSEHAEGEVSNQSIQSDDEIPEASDPEPRMD